MKAVLILTATQPAKIWDSDPLPVTLLLSVHCFLSALTFMVPCHPSRAPSSHSVVLHGSPFCSRVKWSGRCAKFSQEDQASFSPARGLWWRPAAGKRGSVGLGQQCQPHPHTGGGDLGRYGNTFFPCLFAFLCIWKAHTHSVWFFFLHDAFRPQ